MRLFVAIQIPENIQAALASLLQEFRAIAPHLKWVRAENLHLTLKFLGETDPAKRAAIEQSLATIHSPATVTLNFTGLGFFPSAKRPRVLWAGINASPNLQPLASEIDRSSLQLGFPAEDRPFTPHLTLARVSEPRFPPQLTDAIAANASRQFGSFTAHQFHLIESNLKSAGTEYTTLQSFSFVSEAPR